MVFALVGHLFSLESPRGLYLVRNFSSFISMTYLIVSQAEFDFLQMTV